MPGSITLAVDVAAGEPEVFDILTSTCGQRGFWTPDCDVSAHHARFGFAQSPIDLLVDITTEPGKLVRMRVTSGFPFWTGSTWEWELGAASRAESGTGIVFRHHGFAEGYPEADLGHTAQTWAMIHDRLVQYVATGTAVPFLS
ncbi:MAG TPA: hypothetical protein VGG05_18105 [Pseudonocardiaceae bacterium]|jgi:hypothetical protein